MASGVHTDLSSLGCSSSLLQHLVHKTQEETGGGLVTRHRGNQGTYQAPPVLAASTTPHHTTPHHTTLHHTTLHNTTPPECPAVQVLPGLSYSPHWPLYSPPPAPSPSSAPPAHPVRAPLPRQIAPQRPATSCAGPHASPQAGTGWRRRLPLQ